MLSLVMIAADRSELLALMHLVLLQPMTLFKPANVTTPHLEVMNAGMAHKVTDTFYPEM